MKKYTVKEVASKLNKSVSYISKLCRSGELKATKNMNGEWEIRENALKYFQDGIVLKETIVRDCKCAFFGSKFMFDRDGYPDYDGSMPFGEYIGKYKAEHVSEMKLLIKKLVKDKGVNYFISTAQFGYDLYFLYALVDLKTKDINYRNIVIELALPYRGCYDSMEYPNKYFHIFMKDVIKDVEIGIRKYYVDELPNYSNGINTKIGLHCDDKIKRAVEYAINSCDYFAMKVDKINDTKGLYHLFDRYAKGKRNVKSIIDVQVFEK